MDIYATIMLFIFILGYGCIILEHVLKIDKATIAILTGVCCWVVQYASGASTCETNASCLTHHISNIAQIIFFLLGALAIVELISIHKGFAIISNAMKVTSKCKLLWIMSGLSFVLSAILDNLTTTVVMISLLKKLLDEGEDRLIIGGAVVIAANAGGAWTPIGDVTTTMLWIGGQLTTIPIMRDLFLSSLATVLVSAASLSLFLKGDLIPKKNIKGDKLEPKGELIFFLGIATLIFVPIFKLLTGLPPFMGVLFGFGVLWVVSDIVHAGHKDREHLRMISTFSRIEFSGLFFFLGMLLAINALESAGVLENLAHWMTHHIGNTTIIATAIGLVSAIVDNVPLVAATMGMYTLEQYPPDHEFWQLIAFCAGTGGSILVIGSAAGVVFMGLEKVNFMWYVRRISLAAALGYFVGIGVYLLI